MDVRIINWKIVASGWWFIWIVQWCTHLQTFKKKYMNSVVPCATLPPLVSVSGTHWRCGFVIANSLLVASPLINLFVHLYTRSTVLPLRAFVASTPLSALLVELSNNLWTLFWPAQNSRPAVICSTFHSLWLFIAFFLWVHSANRTVRWDVSQFYICCSENM